MFNLLDVAAGPILLFFGVGLLLGIGAIIVIVYFSVRAIQKIKRERDENV